MSSLQKESQLAQAQHSISHLQQAIQQAQSHHNEEILAQIQHSLDRTERSVLQAETVTDNEQAIVLIQQECRQHLAVR